MIILDTNVLSALTRRIPDASVVAWLDQQPRTSIWTTSVTIFEIRFGLQIMPAGKRKTTLTTALEEIFSKINHRIASFDAAAAQRAADLTAIRHRKGRPVALRDTMIAGIVLTHNATLATGNTAHFADLAARIVNPWTA
jgi:predicted nucleic acid-binding protein